jgi:hypothetical protein
MALKNYLIVLSLILLSSGCSSWKPLTEVVTETKIIERNIPTQERPKQVSLEDIQWYVVTEKNMDEFIKRFEDENGTLVFYAMSVRDYETLSLNMADLKRYILQQKEIIVYYEESVKPKEEKTDEL